MKTAVLVVLLTICVAVHARTKCDSNDDCEKNECCIFKIFKSECHAHADLGDRCNDRKDKMFGNKYAMHCPCAEGFECEAERIILNAKFNQRCVPESGTEVPTTTVTEKVTEVTTQ